MNVTAVILVGIPLAAAVVGILAWMGFKVDGPRLYARLKARIQAPRKEREELRRQVAALWKSLDDQMTRNKLQSKLDGQNVRLHEHLSERVTDLQTEVNLLRTDPAPLAIKERVETLEAENARLQAQLESAVLDGGDLVMFVLILAKFLETESTKAWPPDLVRAFEQIETGLAPSRLMEEHRKMRASANGRKGGK